MNKGNDLSQPNNKIRDNSSNHQVHDSKVNQSFTHKKTQGTPGQNEIHINFQALKQRNVLNEFKATLAETEKYTSILNSNTNSNLNISKSMFNQLNENIAFNNSHYNDTIGDTSSITRNDDIIEEDDLFARLKISNEVLLKTNLDLRNTNKILNDEIEAYKNSSVYNSPYSQYDLNLNDFISNIKQALNTSQMSNLELQDIISQTQKKTESLSQANSELIKHYETVKAEYESKTKETSELKIILGNKNNKIEQLNTIIQQLNDKIKQLDDSIVDNEKQINFQMTIDSSYNKYKEDTEEMLTSLQETIETLQKGNVAHISKTNQLQKQIDDQHSQLQSSELMIERLNTEIKLRDDHDKKQVEQFEEMEKMIQKSKDTIFNKQNEIRQLNGNIEKLNSKIESLNLFIEDREKTIETLKASLSILTKAFDNDINAIKSNSTESISVQMLLNDKIEKLNEEILSQQNIIKQMDEENEGLRQDSASFKNKIDDYINQFEQNQYEYQLLYQKYKEQTRLIETLKVEFLNKRKDNELMNLIKANEEILKKLQKIQEENNAKTQEINDLKSNYSKISRELFEAQRLNTSLETQNNCNGTSVNNKNNKNNKKGNDHLFYCEINELANSETSKEVNPLISPNNYYNNRKIIGDYYYYTIIDMNHVISFNLQSKKFKKLPYNDKSGNFNKTIDLFSSMKINFNEGLFIISQFFVFYFNPRDNSIKQVGKLTVPHIKSNAIYINNELYVISGENTRQCQKISFNDWKITQLPDTNYTHIDGGVCLVDNKYLFVLFGECEQGNIIERLNLNFITSWEIMNYTADPLISFTFLSHFICFSNENKIIIAGGITEKRICNQELLQYDYNTERINQKSKSNCDALFNDQISQIDNNLFVTFDIEGNAHMFDKTFTTYELFKISF